MVMKTNHLLSAAAFCGTLLICGCSTSGSTEQLSKDRPMLQEYLSELQGWSADNQLHMMPTMQWEARKEYKIVYRSPVKQLVSFRAWEWAYTGGAHGMPRTKVGTFEKGKRLTLDDIAPTVEEKLRLEKAWQKAIVRHFKAKDFASHVKSRPLFRPYVTENFFLTEKAITFVYDPYEIDSFAAGTIDITIPWEYKKK